MAGEPCSQHSDAQAVYVCDGCEKKLCVACITEGHALLFCNQCGERALPLYADAPATTFAKKQLEAVLKPYTMWQAFGYPFRGHGRYLFVVTLIIMAVLFVIRFIWLQAMFTFLLASMQLRIVETTVNGEDELPDWPEFVDWIERFKDWLTGTFAYLLQFLGVIVLFWSQGLLKVLLAEPDMTFWLLAAFLLWFGIAMSVMALGAAGTFGRHKVLSLHAHVQGFFRAGIDAVHVTNVVYLIGAVLLVGQVALGASSSIVGAALSGVLSAYWFFVYAHLAGLLFRRHQFELEAVY